MWADFFRRAIPIELVQKNFHEAVALATPLAKGHYAKSMPGFNGK